MGGVPIIYDYDVAGRRVGKSVGGEETRFVHAGDMEIAEYDGSGALLRRYIPGGAVDQRVAMIEGSGSCAIGSSGCPDASAFSANDIRYYHADRLGNVAALTDGNGRVTDRYAYDPFGNEITGASTSGNPFRYTGRRYDPETGLYFYRARYYDAPLGRFLQTDPIGYADQWNLYTYVGNDPLSFTDPSGERLKFAPGSRDVFKAAFGAVFIRAALSGNGQDFITAYASDEVFTIRENFDHIHNVNPRTNTINLDITSGIWVEPSVDKNDKGGVLSPATAIAHEIGHVANLIRDRQATFDRKLSGDVVDYENGEVFTDAEEQFVITTRERAIADFYGEPLRQTNRSGYGFKDKPDVILLRDVRVGCVVCTEPIGE